MVRASGGDRRGRDSETTAPHSANRKMSTSESAETQLVTSSLAFVGSFLILLSGAMFPAVSRRETFFQMLLHLAFFDLMVGLAGMMGYPTGDTCITQGVLLHCCLLAAFLWNDIISFNLFTYVAYEKIYLSFFQMNAIIIVTVSVLSLVPLAYGMAYRSQGPGGGSGSTCGLNSLDDDNTKNMQETEIIMLIVFILPLFGSMLFMGTLSGILLLKIIPEKAKEDPAKAERMKSLATYMALYPIGMVLIWIPNVIYFIIYQIQLHTGENSDKTSAVLLSTFEVGLVYGAYTSLVFFTHSTSIRKCWIDWFKRNILRKEESLLDRFQLNSADLRDSTSSADSIDNIILRKNMERNVGLGLQSLSNKRSTDNTNKDEENDQDGEEDEEER